MAVLDYIKLGVMGLLVLGAVFFTHRYDAGQEAERDLADALQYASAVAAANQQRLEAEQRHEAASAAASAASEQRLREHDNALNKTIAGLRAGTLRLRLSADGTPSAGTVPQAGADPGWFVGADGTDIVERLAEDVAQRLALGDKAIVERNQCVQELRNDRSQIF